MAVGFYVKRVARGTSSKGCELHNAIDVFIRTIRGNDFRLRLIPGLDTYFTLMVLQDRIINFYRLDFRLLATSDEAELKGLDQAALISIGNQLCKNKYINDLDAVFISKLVGGLTLPSIPNHDTNYNVTSSKDKIMTVKVLDTGKHFVFGFNASSKAMVKQCDKKVSVVGPMIAKELQRLIRSRYGKQCRAYCSGFIV